MASYEKCRTQSRLCRLGILGNFVTASGRQATGCRIIYHSRPGSFDDGPGLGTRGIGRRGVAGT